MWSGEIFVGSFGALLGQLPFVCPGFTFDVKLRLGARVFGTRKYRILEIVEEHLDGDIGKSTYPLKIGLKTFLAVFSF